MGQIVTEYQTMTRMSGCAGSVLDVAVSFASGGVSNAGERGNVMFETSTVRVTTARAERRVGLLTMSVAMHSLVVLAVIVVSLASIRFPTQAPNQFARLIPIEKPPEMPKGR